MPSGLGLLNAVEDISRSFSLGSTITICRLDEIDLCKLTKQELIDRGFEEGYAEQSVAALNDGHAGPLVEFLGLKLAVAENVPTLEQSETGFRAVTQCLNMIRLLTRHVLRVAQTLGRDDVSLRASRNYQIQLRTILRHAAQSLTASFRDRLATVATPIAFEGRNVSRHELVLFLTEKLLIAIRDFARGIDGRVTDEQQLDRIAFDRWNEACSAIAPTCLELQSIDHDRLVRLLEQEYRAIHMRDLLA